MKAAANVVMKTVGSRIRRANPTVMTMKTRAPRRPSISAPSRENTTTVMVITTKRPRGRPVKAICDRMKDWAEDLADSFRPLLRFGKHKQQQYIQLAKVFLLQIWRVLPIIRFVSQGERFCRASLDLC